MSQTTTSPSPNHNLPEYSVSEISGAIKRCVEDQFGYVRVRGELSGFKVVGSGHAYFKLKDDQSLIDGVCWRGSLAKMAFKPEDGLEVSAFGRITTYPGRSNYQIVVEKMEPAGAGALMALLEERKKKLTAEGLFAAERKKPLPYLPQTIGVITSPTGAVIRDILHRLGERFPCHVLVWPVAVQGEAAAEQIAAAIRGFNQAEIKPDLLIVARGGGSIEDLWAFNEEVVVRAAAESNIPLISAVGHETDTTLIDYAADKRAPTPTAAAEIAVPVRAELVLMVAERGISLTRSLQQLLEQRQLKLAALSHALPKPARLMELAEQRFDHITERLLQALPSWLERKRVEVTQLSARLSPTILLRDTAHKQQHVSQLAERLSQVLPSWIARKREEVAQLSARLSPTLLLKDTTHKQQQVTQLGDRLHQAMRRCYMQKRDGLNQQLRLLESVSHASILKRGFALVQTPEGKLISSSSQAGEETHLQLTFADGAVRVVREG